MPHPARHSRPNIRQQYDQHALGPLLDELGSRRMPAAHRLGEEHAEQRAEHAQQHTSRIHAASVGLLAEPTWAAQPDDNSTAAATAEIPERALVRGPAATSRAAEDPQRALVHALQKDICALQSDMSSRMSALLERLDELL